MSFPNPGGAAADASRGETPGGASILLVDDRTENLVVFRSMLEELGQEIVAVRSGEEALKMLLKQDFAVVLLDVNMPGMDGLETASYMRQRRRTMHTPIIFLTAYIEEMHTAKGYSLGAVDYIMTPVLPEVLRTKVKVFVQLYQMQRQAEREAENRVALAREQAARAAAEDSRRRSTFLAEASHVLAGSLDAQTTAQSLARFLVPFVADLGGIAFGQDDGPPVAYAALAWLDAHGSTRSHQLSPGRIAEPRLAAAIGEALSSGEMRLIEDASDGRALLASLLPVSCDAAPAGEDGLRRLAVLPLLARGHTLGVMLLGMTASGRSFDGLALELASDLAGRAAIALDNCMLYAHIQEQDQRKNEFLAMLAHELRNPLAPIRNAVQLLDTRALDATSIGWATQVLDRQSRQLVRLVDDLLDVARITQGQITLKTERVDATAVLNMAVETCAALIAERDHRLKVTPPPEPLALHGDAARVAQVLSNLLNNAAKYTTRGGNIAIAVESRGDDVVFTVSDDGVGIPPDMLGRIFDLFTQVDRSLDRSQGGLGVGLTIVQRLVELHGGSVRASSPGPGCGSEFVVRFPRAAEASGEQRGLADGASPMRVLRILVVDDYVDSADTVATLLRADGHMVHVCHDGPAALKLAREVQPDVILLDIGLPGMNGYEVAKLVRAEPETRGCLLVALSGYGQSDDHAQSRDAGFDHHLVKPADFTLLREVLDKTEPKERWTGDRALAN